MVVRARIKFGGSEIIQYLINLGNEIGQCNMSTFISDRETRKTDHVSDQSITVNTSIQDRSVCLFCYQKRLKSYLLNFSKQVGIAHIHI